MANRLGTAYAAIALVTGSLAIGLAAGQFHRPHAVQPSTPKAAVILTAPVAQPTAEPTPQTPDPSPAATPAPTPTPVPTPLPASVLIRVPYTPQAPTGNWDTIHQEYCEAAATFMVGRYYRGQAGVIPPAEADKAMGSIVSYERETFPGILDLKLEQIATVGNYFYDLKPTLQPASLEAVKQMLAAGRPVMIPVMTHGAPGGQKIAPGYGSRNVYHIVLLVGYDQNRVYANDAGFMTGQNYPYSWDILQAAMDAQTAQTGQGRVMLTFSQA